ncbi:Uncharacterised protein [Serratia grimesii]|uniref:hypothetical protein n=1 Tax=Serratia grimesii TaxID=82995 RepID=UPI0021C4EDE7|nr:hypothetical protein [Serratia grimesii]CAI2790850.1 Uncharacterised protein [Serratia grimesii]
MKINKSFYFLGAIFLCFFVYIVFFYFKKVGNDEFECKSYLNFNIDTNDCQGDSSFDIFLAMHGEGKGYLIAKGNYKCLNGMSTSVDEIVNFTYNKEGDYNTIKLGERSPEIITLFGVLKYNVMKLKITPIDSGVYQLNLPLRSSMVCRRVDNLK